MSVLVASSYSFPQPLCVQRGMVSMEWSVEVEVVGCCCELATATLLDFFLEGSRRTWV